MGLSISYSIIESHGGRLGIVPSSSGALFQFILPTSDASAS
jgi:signal transduction histidine kinase